MKAFLIPVIIVVSGLMLFQPTISIFIVDDILVGHESLTLLKTIYSAATESKNIIEFFNNVIDPDEKHQKFVEANLVAIQTSLTHIKKAITQFSADLKHLKFSIDLNHFDDNIKYRTKQIFHSVQRFFEHPTNSTRNGLLWQCNNSPPNSILEILEEFLHDNWLIDLSRHFNYESPALKELIEKVDKIVKILAISEAACTGMSDSTETAKYDLKKMAEIIKKIVHQINRSKNFIHKNYFNHSRIFVREYLSNVRPSFLGSELVIELLEHYQTKYNYGPLYTVGFSLYEIYGNLQPEFSFIEKFHNKRFIFVLQSPTLCSFNTVKDKEFLDTLAETCSTNNSLSELYASKCGKEYACAYITRRHCHTETYIALASYASNGGVCGYGGGQVQAIVAMPMPTNFKYKPLKIRSKFLYDWYFYLEKHYTKGNSTKPIKKEKAQSIIFDPIEYIEDKYFMEQDFSNLLTSTNTTTEYEADILPKVKVVDPPSPVLISQGWNKEKGYSNFREGYNYIFNGKVVCANGEPIGDDAMVYLIEVDEFSFDDTVASQKIVNGHFSLKVDSTYTDYPTRVLELKLKFEDCCNYWFDRYAKFLINNTLCEYTIP